MGTHNILSLQGKRHYGKCMHFTVLGLVENYFFARDHVRWGLATCCWNARLPPTHSNLCKPRLQKGKEVLLIYRKSHFCEFSLLRTWRGSAFGTHGPYKSVTSQYNRFGQLVLHKLMKAPPKVLGKKGPQLGPFPQKTSKLPSSP